MSDHHYCPFCGASDAFCGCPDDPNTTDVMHCPHCAGSWRRDYGDPTTTCLHSECRKDGSTVEKPAKYPPTLPDSLSTVLQAAHCGDLQRSTRDGGGWKIGDAPATGDVELLRRWGYLKAEDTDKHYATVRLTIAGRRLLEHAETTAAPADTEEPRC